MIFDEIRAAISCYTLNTRAEKAGESGEADPKRPVATWQHFQAVRTAMKELAEKTGNQRWVRMEFALVLAEATGRRIGSIRQLAWEDIDFKAGTIRWRAEADKKRREWMVPMPPALVEEAKRFRMLLGGAFGGLVFPAPTDASKALGRDVFQHALGDAALHADLPKIGGGTPSGGNGPQSESITHRWTFSQLAGGVPRV